CLPTTNAALWCRGGWRCSLNSLLADLATRGAPDLTGCARHRRGLDLGFNQFVPTASAAVRSDNPHLEGRVVLCQRQSISILEIDFWKTTVVNFLWLLVRAALADFRTVDERAIATAEVAHPDGGRVDFKQAMVTRDETMILVIRHAWITVLIPSE